MRTLITIAIACMSAGCVVAKVPAQQHAMWAVIDKHGRITVPFANRFPADIPFPPNMRDQQRRDGIVIRSVSNTEDSTFHTEREATHELIATFPQHWHLENFEPNGLIRVSRLDFASGAQMKIYGGFVRSTGEVTVPPNYRALSFLDPPVGDFGSVDLAPVQKEEKAGFVDSEGKEHFNLDLSRSREFGEGQVAPVRMNGKWGYVDKNLKFAILPKFDDAQPFSRNGLAAASVNDMWGYIDHSGNFKIAPKYDQAWPFGPTGLAVVEMKSKDQIFLDKDIGAWHLKAVVLAIPSPQPIRPYPVGFIQVSGHSNDGLVEWTVETTGQTVNVSTKVGDVYLSSSSMDDFPKNDPERTIIDILLSETDGTGGRSVTMMSSDPQKNAPLEIQRRNFESSRDTLKKQIMVSEPDLIASLRTMIRTSSELFGKLSGPDRCVFPSCIY